MEGMTKNIFALIALFCCVPAQAGDALAGMLSVPHFMSTGKFLVSTDGQRLGTPTCASGSPTRFAVDANTTAGKNQLAGLLAAYTAGKAVRIVGTGDCLVYGDSETIDYFYIVD